MKNSKAIALSLIACPLFLLASALVSPAIKSDEGAQLTVVAQHPDRWYVSTILMLVGSILIVPALMGISALVAERSPRLAYVGGALAVLGAIIAVGDVMSQLVTWQMVAKGADHAQMAALLKRSDDATGSAMVFNVGGLGIVIGSLLLTIGMIRARVAPVWVAIGLTLAVIVNIAGYGAASNATVGLSWLVLLGTFGYLGRAMLDTSPRPANRVALA
jgi:hypothetical protein